MATISYFVVKERSTAPTQIFISLTQVKVLFASSLFSAKKKKKDARLVAATLLGPGCHGYGNRTRRRPGSKLGGVNPLAFQLQNGRTLASDRCSRSSCAFSGRAVFTAEVYLRPARVVVIGAETQETRRDWIQALTKVRPPLFFFFSFSFCFHRRALAYFHLFLHGTLAYSPPTQMCHLSTLVLVGS